MELQRIFYLLFGIIATINGIVLKRSKRGDDTNVFSEFYAGYFLIRMNDFFLIVIVESSVFQMIYCHS